MLAYAQPRGSNVQRGLVKMKWVAIEVATHPPVGIERTIVVRCGRHFI